jgi:UDP-GlcNAc:undecaprenyl-phosphate/decaprenyl-phosphate GlcNAc-1-phosphate transferase
MIYLIVAIALFLLMLAYFEVAKAFDIVDKPNHRSSHSGIVIRGGGVVFVFAVWISMNYLESIPWYFLLGFTIVAVISFIDDRITLGTKTRMFAQFLASFLLLYQLEFLGLPIWSMPIIAVFCVATLNAYNFMDGINGINGLYSLSIFLSLLWANVFIHFMDNVFLFFMIISVVVFGFFNFRKKALCFSGDVGSVSIAFAILFMVLSLIVKTGDLSFVLLLLLYGLDAFWTVVQRVIRGEKITEAHRLHLYQILSNEWKMPHLLVSLMYFLVQLIISYVIIDNYNEQFMSPLLLSAALIVGVSLAYILLKIQLMKVLKRY